MTTSATLPAPVPEQQPTPRRGNGFGITALILGIVAFLLGLIPFAGFGTWFIGLLAIIFGVIGATRRGRPKVLAVIGTVLGVISIVVGLAISISATSAVVSAVNNENNKVTAHTVEYRATSDGKNVDVTYETYQNDKSESVDKTFAAPFSKVVKFTTKGDFDFGSYTMTAQSKSDSNDATATCTLIVDGVTKAHDSAKGPFATAACTATN